VQPSRNVELVQQSAEVSRDECVTGADGVDHVDGEARTIDNAGR
jgi:hypothetical protein